MLKVWVGIRRAWKKCVSRGRGVQTMEKSAMCGRLEWVVLEVRGA